MNEIKEQKAPSDIYGHVKKPTLLSFPLWISYRYAQIDTPEASYIAITNFIEFVKRLHFVLTSLIDTLYIFDRSKVKSLIELLDSILNFKSFNMNFLQFLNNFIIALITFLKNYPYINVKLGYLKEQLENFEELNKISMINIKANIHWLGNWAIEEGNTKFYIVIKSYKAYVELKKYLKRYSYEILDGEQIGFDTWRIKALSFIDPIGTKQLLEDLLSNFVYKDKIIEIENLEFIRKEDLVTKEEIIEFKKKFLKREKLLPLYEQEIKRKSHLPNYSVNPNVTYINEMVISPAEKTQPTERPRMFTRFQNPEYALSLRDIHEYKHGLEGSPQSAKNLLIDILESL